MIVILLFRRKTLRQAFAGNAELGYQKHALCSRAADREPKYDVSAVKSARVSSHLQWTAVRPASPSQVPQIEPLPSISTNRRKVQSF